MPTPITVALIGMWIYAAVAMRTPCEGAWKLLTYLIAVIVSLGLFSLYYVGASCVNLSSG
jgi:hypothetical protein